MPPQASRKLSPKPTRLAALVCAAVAAAYDRRWLSAALVELRGEDDPTPATLSRLKARLIEPIAALVEGAHRRGRPPADAGVAEIASLRARLAARDEQLALAASVIAERGVRKRQLQERLVAAAQRLHSEHGVSRRDFCAGLGIAERTFRHWSSRPALPPASPTPPPATPRQPNRNVGRFALELCPPDLQALADTTAIRAFGVDLRLVATQDPGRRHQELLSAFAASENENADLVVDVVTRALAELPGAQLLVDQGTPYMAEATRTACDHLEVEHEPQKEATPTEKPTIERAFGTVKSALAPLLALTDHLAGALPALRRADLARAATTLLLGVFLRVYAASRRHLPHPLAGADPGALRDAVDAARDRARAEQRSRKLFLQTLHEEYRLGEYVSPDAFVRAHRHHALEDLKAAERALRTHACRCDARRCDRYFTGILRRVAEEGRARRAREAAQRAQERRRRDEEARFEALDRHLSEHPRLRLVQALDSLAEQWDPVAGAFLFGGKGWPRGQLHRALADLKQIAPLVWIYEVDATFKNWVASAAVAPQPLAAISALLDAASARPPPPPPAPPAPFPTPPPRATVPSQARGKTTENPRPPPTPGLTI